MFDIVERGLYWLSSYFLEGDVDAHCQLRAPLNEHSLVTMADDLMSIIEIRGARKLVGDTETEAMSQNLAKSMANVMKFGNGALHSFAFGFRSSPQSAQRLLMEMHEPSLRTSRRLGIEETIHLRDSVSALSGRCVEESAYLILYTHVSGLSPADRKRLHETRDKAAEKYAAAAPGMRLTDDISQRPRVPATTLIARHEATVNQFMKDLTADLQSGGIGILASVLDVGHGLSMMRRHLDASTFDSRWRPALLGDKRAVVPGAASRTRDASHMTPMRLGRQMVAEPLREFFGDIEFAKRGNICYASVVLEVPPEEGGLPFTLLANRVGRQIPWSANIELVPNGENLRKVDQMYAGFVGAMGDYNKAVKEGWQAIKALRRSGVYIAAIRATFSTWGNSEDEVLANLNLLRSSIEAWGSAVVTNETGAPGVLALAAAAGFSKRMPARYIPGPIDDLARMLPISRPASVWESGQLVAHTKEGRPYPVMLGSTLQLFWGTLIFAPSGSGKSFLMNQLNQGILMSPGLEEIPYVTIVDVGPSSRLVMDQVRAMLPESKRRQIASIRIRNSKEFAVNPFDTQLGLDRPTQVDRDYLISVVATVVPGLGIEGERFIGQVIDEAYKMLGRRSTQQRRWQSSMDDSVSKALEEIGFDLSERTFVWDVTDALFDAGRIGAAVTAQRYAVPRLPDLIKAARAKEILDAYGSAPSETGEPLLSVFDRGIQTALSEYEMISDVTRFDVGDARAVSIDLEEVVTSTDSEEGKRRAALMFLFARRLGAKNYFLRWPEIEDLVPDRYRDYQERRIKGIEEALKFLEYDEVHYATGIPPMAKRLQEDLRVGRKYKIVTMMASQLLQDFPPAAVDNCYTYFILGAGTESTLDVLQRTFGLNASEIAAIKSECTMPGRLFGMFKTTKGATSQVLYTGAGPFTQWSFTTSKDDGILREEVKRLLHGDYLRTLKMLAAAFPSGSCREAMERYRLSRGDEVTGETVAQVFARKVVAGDFERGVVA